MSQNPSSSRARVTLLVNMIAPYRVPVYAGLGRAFELTIFHGGAEENRPGWGAVANQLSGVQVRKVAPLRVTQRLAAADGVYDYRYVDVTLGYLWGLVRTRPQAVISNEMGLRTLSALLYGTLWRKPVWVWWGGTLHTERNKGRLRRLIRWLIVRWARHWISYGATSTEYLVHIGATRERVVEIQNCVDERIYRSSVAPTVGLQPKPVLLYVGQFILRKGVSHFLEASAKLQKAGRSFSLLLVGGGPEEQGLREWAARLGLQDIHFLPSQSPEKMPGIYRSADCLVLPTLEDVWGLVVNEALWSGVPVIASRYAGCAPELLPPTNIFDPSNQEDFIAALQRVLDGKITRPDPGRLRTCEDVTLLIVDDIKRVLSWV